MTNVTPVSVHTRETRMWGVMATRQEQEDRYTVSFQLRRNTSTAEVSISLQKKSQRFNFES